MLNNLVRMAVTEESAVRAMTQLRTDVGKNRLVEKDILVKMPYCPRSGILSAYLVRKSQDLIAFLLANIPLSWKKQTGLSTRYSTHSRTCSGNGGCIFMAFSREA